jgi:hypothetical protein
MGNQQSSAQNIRKISMKVEFNPELNIWRVIFVVDSIEFNNPFDVLYFYSDQHPVGLEIIPHSDMQEVKKFRIIFEDSSTSCGWIYMDDANPQSFQVLPVARTGQRLRNHPTKFYICDRIEGTTEWVITIFEVRDIHGNLATPPPENEIVMFSAGCRITERSIIDTGSIQIPELEYDAASNENRMIERIYYETIYEIMNHHLQQGINQTNVFINQLNY